MGYESPKRDATVCHWCQEKFEPGQARYLVEDDIEAWPGWERVSICGLCWKESVGIGTGQIDNDAVEIGQLFRKAGMTEKPSKRAYVPLRTDKCLGCGETIKVPQNWRRGPKSSSSQIIVGALCCSNRCHQRARRKYRERWPQRCGVCKNQFTPSRTDARYCSDPCRQWAYRRRKAQKPVTESSRHGIASRVTGSIEPRDVT